MNWKAAVLQAGLIACLSVPGQAGDVKKPENPVQSLAFGEGEYRLGSEDVIEVFVWKEPDLTATVVVRPDGKVSLPLIGEMEASGKTASALQQEVRVKLRQYIADPVVNVIVKEVNSPKVSVLGQVRKPDRYRIKQRITVMEAIALAGGFTDFAKRDRVIVIRDKARIEVNLKRLLKDGRSGEVYLEPFDTVYVE